VSVVDVRAVGLRDRRAGIEITMTPWWPRTWRVLAVVAGSPRFSGLVARPTAELALIHDCLPPRPDPEVVRALVAVARHVRTDLDTAEVVAVHPVSWDDLLAEHAVTPLHRMAELGVLLDEDRCGRTGGRRRTATRWRRCGPRPRRTWPP
jgi:hypothetical protein